MAMGRENEIVAIRAGRPRPIPCNLDIRRQNAKHHLSCDGPCASVDTDIMTKPGVQAMGRPPRCGHGREAVRMRQAAASTKQGAYKCSSEKDCFHRQASPPMSQPRQGTTCSGGDLLMASARRI